MSLPLPEDFRGVIVWEVIILPRLPRHLLVALEVHMVELAITIACFLLLEDLLIPIGIQEGMDLEEEVLVAQEPRMLPIRETFWNLIKINKISFVPNL